MNELAVALSELGLMLSLKEAKTELPPLSGGI